jgi:hypothetical protein
VLILGGKLMPIGAGTLAYTNKIVRYDLAANTCADIAAVLPVFCENVKVAWSPARGAAYVLPSLVSPDGIA